MPGGGHYVGECSERAGLCSARRGGEGFRFRVAAYREIPQESALTDDPKQQAAAAQFKKLQRAEDGKKAMSEYEADAVAVRVRMAKLRELRLARDAAAPPAAAPAKKGGKKKKAATGSLSTWLKDREDSGHNN